MYLHEPTDPFCLVYMYIFLRCCFSQDKKISRSQRRLEEGGQGAMAMDTAALRKNEEIIALDAQARPRAL